MIASLAYILACLICAGVLTFIYGLMRSVQSRDDWKSWRTFALLFAICVFSPYGYIEVQTNMVGKEMKSAVIHGLSDAELHGKLEYYKVLSQKGNKAKVVATVTEEEAGVGTQRAVVQLQLQQTEKGGWQADSYDVVNSDRLNRDGFTIPPFF